ncbi:MAG: sensor histidine kinase, partial [Candidatus Geothermincolia bacterium]
MTEVEMPFERKLTSILTTICLVAIPAVAAILYLPHREPIDYPVVILALLTISVTVLVLNLSNIFPPERKLFGHMPPFFLGLIPFYFAATVLIFFSGGLDSAFYFPLLLAPLVAGTVFSLRLALASTSILVVFYLGVVFSHAPLAGGDTQPLVFNVVYLYFACFLANRMTFELRRQQRSREEVLNLADFISNVEKTKTDFISTVSHELRTPLTSIQGFSEMLRTRSLDAGKKREFYQIILNESERLSRMITELLNLSKIETGLELSKEMLDITRIIEEDIAFFANQAPRHRIVYENHKRLPLVYADRDKVHQIMKNLISNAIKYSPEGGSVELDAGIEGKFMRIS